MNDLKDIRQEDLPLIRQLLIQNVETDPETECWWWQGKFDGNGYGRVKIPTIASPGYKWVSTHRLAYVLSKGDIPKRTMLGRICGNPMCCNPDHLYLDTKEV